MQAGDQTEWIEIQRKRVTKDPQYGRDVVSWVPIQTLPGSPTTADPMWAQWMDMLPSRSEAVRNGLDTARNQSRVRIPYRQDVDSTMRIIRKYEGDQVYQIVGGPSIIGQREWLEMVVERYSL